MEDELPTETEKNMAEEESLCGVEIRNGDDGNEMEGKD